MNGELPPGYSELDKSGMLNRVLSYFRDLEEAVHKYSGTKLEVEIPDPLGSVIVTGMGGSFIGALFLHDLLHDSWQTPIFALKELALPAFVDKHHLLIAVSYSGNTEETIRVLVEARRRGVPSVAVTSGGLIAEYADKLSYQVIRLPSGLAPRAAFPYILTALAAVFDAIDSSLKLVKSIGSSALNLVRHCDTMQRSATELAGWMLQNYTAHRLPIIYAYRPYLSAGYRFKTQINENAKLHAFFSEIPESNHNEIMGWETESNLFTAIIRDDESPQLQYRIEFLLDLWRRRGIPFKEIKPHGGNRLENLLSLFYISDLTSVLLALKRAIDPTPVETISQLKKFLDTRIDVRRIFSP